MLKMKKYELKWKNFKRDFLALLVKIERLKHATTVLMVFLAYLGLNTPKTRSRSLKSHKKCKKVGFKHFDKTEKYMEDNSHIFPQASLDAFMEKIKKARNLF